MKNLLSVAIIAIITLSSCSKYNIKGAGSIISETRSIPAIDKVILNGSEDLEIIPSTQDKIVVTGYQNLVPVYGTNANGNTLNLAFESSYWNVRNNNIKLTLYTTNLNNIVLNGSGAITVRDSLRTSSLAISVNGSGNITTNNNYFNDIRLSINGSGEINAQHTSAQYVDANVSGSGAIDITALITLDATISGSGEINYWGNPTTVNKHIAGSGAINKR